MTEDLNPLLARILAGMEIASKRRGSVDAVTPIDACGMTLVVCSQFAAELRDDLLSGKIRSSAARTAEALRLLYEHAARDLGAIVDDAVRMNEASSDTMGPPAGTAD